MSRFVLSLTLSMSLSSASASIMMPGLFAHANTLAQSFAPPCPPCQSLDSHGDISFTTGIPAAVAGTVFVGADASSTANASFGVLHASGNATASTVAMGSEAVGTGEAGWLDIFTVVSNTLAPGTPVDLRFTAVLEGNLGSAPSNGTGQQSTASGSFMLTIGSVLNSFGCPDAISPCGLNDVGVSTMAMSMNDSFSGVPLPSTTHFVLTTSVGAQFFAESVLGASASAFTAGTAMADFSDTGFVTLESLTPGASFTTASGTTYSPAAAVPEPATFYLAGCAILFGVISRKVFSRHG